MTELEVRLIHQFAAKHNSAREFIHAFHTAIDVAVEPACLIACLIACLGLTTRAYNLLTRGTELQDPPSTVADVIDLVTNGGIADITGLGPRPTGEIRTRLIFVGFVLDSSISGKQQ